MNNSASLATLKSTLSTYRDEDLISAAHIFNDFTLRLDRHSRNHREAAEALDHDIDLINGITKASDIIKIITNHFSERGSRLIDDFIIALEDHRSNVKKPGFNYSNLEDNYRFLNFANTLMITELRENKLNRMNNPYFCFLYITSTYFDYYENPRAIESIYTRFDKIYSKYTTHFKFADSNFYTWAKNYINDRDEFRRLRTTTVSSTHFELIINSVFDLLYEQDIHTHYALRKKLSNAWYQKKHREEKKVRKPGYYALTTKTKEALAVLAEKFNMSQDKVIDMLVNKTYALECKTDTGQDMY